MRLLFLLRKALSLVRRARAWLGLRRSPDGGAPQSLVVEDPAPPGDGGAPRVMGLGISTATRHSGSKPKGLRQPKKGKRRGT